MSGVETIEECDRTINQGLSQLRQVLQKRQALQGKHPRRSLYPMDPSDEMAWKFYRRQSETLWGVGDLEFSRDSESYRNLSDRERRLVDITFAFFSGADADVINELTFRFLLEVESFPETCFYLSQLYTETVHADVYGQLINSLPATSEHRERLLEAADHIPVIGKIHAWMDQFMTGDFSPVERFAACAATEGIIFQAPFLFLFWFRPQGKMENMILANMWISRDEALHAAYGCHKVKTLLERGASSEGVHRIVQEGLDLTKELIDLVLRDPDTHEPFHLPGLTRDQAFCYADLQASSVLQRMGLPAPKVTGSVPSYMMEIGSKTVANFYEERDSEYKKTPTQKSRGDQEEDDDF